MSRRVFQTPDGELTVSSEITGTTLSCVIGGEQPLQGEFIRTGPRSGIWSVNGSRYAVAAVEHKGELWASVNGSVVRLPLVDPDEPAGAVALENAVSAPMPGKVIKLFKAVGDEVQEGDPVIVVEAMKMEHTLRAPTAGTITEIRCAEGDQVEGNIPLLEIEA